MSAADDLDRASASRIMSTGSRAARIVAIACAGVLVACSSDSPTSTSTTSGSATTAPRPSSVATASPSSADGTDSTTVPASDSSSPIAETTIAGAPTSEADPDVVGPTSSTPPDPAQLAFTEIATVSNPTDLAYRNGDPRVFIVSADGFIVSMLDGEIDETELLDISGDITSGGEQGLLGLAFSNDGTHAYVNYTNGDGDTEVTEYAVDGEGVFDPASKRLLMEIDQPYANHNGGGVHIGADGYLYIGMGDGGSGGDPERHALNVDSLLGKMLRIDPAPSADAPYSIPPDNPFVGVAGARPEIYAVGLRNPWRFSFDVATGDLWIADVGQNAWEEVDVAWADEGGGNGANYGWSAYEGTHRFNEDQPEDGVVMPIHEYEHGVDCSISGGVRYRGNAVASLFGWYVYGDYCSGQVRAFPVLDDRTAGDEVTLSTELSAISAVAQGPDGELYVLTFDDGRIYAIQFTG